MINVFKLFSLASKIIIWLNVWRKVNKETSFKTKQNNPSNISTPPTTKKFANPNQTNQTNNTHKQQPN